jgi:glycerophosphoryl diester phosphodiesterase
MQPDTRMSNPFPHLLILGHRGAPAEALENTLRAFELALRRGADGVELDVRPAEDGTPVVIHDDGLERTFGMSGLVSELSWPALQRLTGARLPSFEQAAAWAAASGAWLNVELKAEGVEAEVIRILRGHGLMSRAFLSSFDEAIVARVGEVAPDALRFFLTETWDDAAHDRLNRSGAAGVCLRVDAATPLALEVLRHEGLPVVVWTVDDVTRIGHLLAAGVAAIITNHPETGVAARRGAGASG